MTDIVTFHHHPSLAKSSRRESAIVHVADSLACEKRIGLLDDADAETPIDPLAFEIAGMTKDQYRDARDRILDEMNAANGMFS